MNGITMFLLSVVALPWGLDEGTPPSPSGRHAIRSGGERIAASAGEQAKPSRRRRRRPQKRGGRYDVTEVKNGGTIEGVVLYRGEIPAPRRIQIVKDQETCQHRDKTAPRIKVNDGKQVEEVVVFLGDIKSGKGIESTATIPVIDQQTCTFSPHVQVLVMDQPIEIVNSDPITHNAHVTQNMMTVINPLQPRQGMRLEFEFTDIGPARVKCNIHDWMQAFVYVLWHPYYAITGSDGSFRMTDVPAGEYELVAWQEYLGERSMKVQVEAGKTTSVRFDLTEE